MEQKGFFDGPPKTMFAFGLVAGIALSALFGYIYPGAAAAPAQVAAQPSQPSAVADAAPSAPAAAMPEVDDKEDHVRGNLKKAKVVLVEYSDFECPFCQRHHPTMQALIDKYGDDVAWVYRHFPLTSIHPQAQPAAEASECAADQDKFWEFGDALFAAGPQALNADFYSQVAGELGLNVSKFEDCLDSGTYREKVQQQQAAGAAAGVTGTPATFVNGQLLPGAVPQAQLEQIIDSML